jgi:EthD domain
MIKTIAFLKRKAGLTREEFIRRYETAHAPLILSIAPQVCDYRRNFLLPEGAITAPGASGLDFDVVTELWYPDRAAFEAAMAAFTAPANAARIAADEEQVFDRNYTRFYVVEERSSVIGAR